MSPSIYLMESTCHTTNLITSHSTLTRNPTTHHVLLATSHNLLMHFPRSHTTKNPSTLQHHSIKKSSTTRDTCTFPHSQTNPQPTLQTLEEKIERDIESWKEISDKPLFSKNVTTNVGHAFPKLLGVDSQRSTHFMSSLTETSTCRQIFSQKFPTWRFFPYLLLSRLKYEPYCVPLSFSVIRTWLWRLLL